MKRTSWLILTLAAIAACGPGNVSPEDGLTSEVTQALEAPLETPVPNSGWTGTRAELALADAWAECSFINVGGTIEEPISHLTSSITVQDSYLVKILDRMSQVPCDDPNPVATFYRDNLSIPVVLTALARWHGLRTKASCNHDPSTNLPKAAPLKKITLRERIPDIQGDGWSVDWAEGELRNAPMNLCIAQRLRDRVPGSSGTEALLWSAQDQRQLLEIVRERAQIASIYYALLGRVFGTNWHADHPEVTGVLYPNREEYIIPPLYHWAHAGGYDGKTKQQILEKMADDFATAVQLHLSATEDMAQLLLRSADARLPYGAPVDATSAQERWGPGSWVQRTMALLYGGDPLSVEPGGTTPWTHPLGNNSQTAPWPGSNPLRQGNARYASSYRATPEAKQLLGLARSADALDIIPIPAGECETIDIAATASKIYSNIETSLRKQDCETASPRNDCSTPAPPPDHPATSYPDYLLWKKYKLNFEHAADLAHNLRSTLSPLCIFQDGGGAVIGTRNIKGNGENEGIVVKDPQSKTQVRYYHITPHTTFPERNIMQQAELYAGYDRASLRIPDKFYGLSPSSSILEYKANQSFGTWALNEYRAMGATAALGLVRDALLAPAPSDLTATYYRNREKLLRVIGSAIGDESVVLRPELEEVLQGVPSKWQLRNVQDVARGVVDGAPSYFWHVDLLVAPENAWWKPSDYGQYRIRTYREGLADSRRENLLLYQDTRLGQHPVVGGGTDQGKAPGTWADNASDFYSEAAPVGPPTPVIIGGRTHHRWRFRVSIHAPPSIDGSQPLAVWMFVASRQLAQDSTPQDRLLLSTPHPKPPLTVFSPGEERKLQTAGRIFSVGGSLGEIARKATATDSEDILEPAFDAFGTSRNEAPSTDPQLTGEGSAAAVQYYLDLAEEAAASASSAVDAAIDNALLQQTDEDVFNAAIDAANQLKQQEKEQLCGDATQACNAALQIVRLPIESYMPGGPPICPPTAPPDPQGQLACLTYDLLRGNIGGDFNVASEVWARVTDATVPAFSAYSGGELQGLFVEQWTALRAARLAAGDLISAMGAASQQITAYQAVESSLSEKARIACSDESRLQAIRAGTTTTTGTSTTTGVSVGVGASVGLFPSVNVNVSVSQSWTESSSTSHSDAPLIAQEQKCVDLTLDAAPPVRQTIAAVFEAQHGLVTRATQLMQAASHVQLASAAVASANRRTDIAARRAELDAELVGRGKKTSFGLYRRYTDHAAWVAMAELENARRAALLARRAIEARYVVNLSKLYANEALVVSPASWADEIYEFDLSMPAAIGYVEGGPLPEDIYGNKLSIYVDNLKRFVAGYAHPSTRHVTFSGEVTNLIALPGPEAAAPGAPSTLLGEARRWSFLCEPASGGVWVGMPASGKVADACLQYGPALRPTQAKLLFTLDPWGRIDGNVSQPPDQFDIVNLFNTRWTRFAVNLAGAGVLNCSLATDHNSCIQNASVPVSVTQLGSSWVKDYDRQWQTIAFLPGFVGGAKAMAADLVLSLDNTSWDDPNIQNSHRSDFRDRSVGGTYELNFKLGPEVLLQNLDYVQILSGTQHWTRQP
ncbi:MAG TPA: hypothetical protein VFS43_04110 [Polyangiaceae bacterium]|nr:hypothetical protein [Polyangiaceae bacterium]